MATGDAPNAGATSFRGVLTAVTESTPIHYAGLMQRVIGIIVLILVLFWIISAPTSAAGTVNAVLADLRGAGRSVITFLDALV